MKGCGMSAKQALPTEARTGTKTEAKTGTFKATRDIAASLVGAILLVALGAAVSFWALRQIENAAEARKHVNEVVSRADALLSELKDAETGQRGYLLTGDEAFLEPYLLVRDSIRGHREELRQLSSIGAAQKHLDALAPLIDAKLAEMAHVIELRRNHDSTAALAIVRSGEGKRLMDAIRAEISGVSQLEHDALAQQDVLLQSNMRRLFTVIVTACLFGLLLALLFAYSIHRETQHRLKNLVHLETQHLLDMQKETSQQLQQANVTLQLSEAKLSVTLHSIGDAVIATDVEGRVTLLNPLAEQLTGWPQAEATNRPVAEIFHIINQETRQLAAIPVMKTLEHGTKQGLANHTVLIARDGSECPIADSCAPIRDRDGRVAGAVLVFRDVTKEEAARHALRDIQERSTFALQMTHTGGWDFDLVDHISHRTLEHDRIFGYDSLQPHWTYEIFLEHVLPEHRAEVDRLFHEAIAAQTPWSFQCRICRADGELRWIWASGEPQRDKAGQPRRMAGVIQDITERKRAEESLLEAGALQRAIFNSANFSSIATDAKGVIQIFNVGAERMLGYAAADVMNKITPADISDPQEVIERAKALSLELSTPITPGFEALVFKASRGIEDIYELTYIRQDGSRFPAVVSVTALRDAQNAIIGYLLIGTDNTARKQVEAEQKKLDQRLRDQQFYTRSLIESNIDAIMTTDPSGIITDVNKQMEALTGCTRDELIGAPFKNYFTDPQRAEAAIKLVLSQKKVTDYELTARARDGKKTEVSYNATTFYDRDRTLQGVFAAARDVTDRKRNEQALQETNVELESAKSAAEKANLAKSDFLSSMSHELRSPLNAILGFAQVMESASPLPTEPQRENITLILQAGWHLLRLIEEILDLARIESGKVLLSPESVSVAEVISECQSMMEPQAQKRGISVTFPRFDNPFFVTADRTRLKQIVINLLSNAIKYNKERGMVVIDCAPSTPGRTRISVKDTGPGLSPEKLAQLFEPFNRLGQETGGVAGTGIGLVVTKRLAELLDGALGVESTVGAGSVFWCELNSSAAPQLAVESGGGAIFDPSPVPAGARLRTLLYVEDNPANMRLVEQLIERRPDIKLLTAGDGNLGIKVARTAQPTVILMDINLPGISGVEALKILREDPATAHIPVVALSANAMAHDIQMGLEVGFFRYLTKPVQVGEFLDTLNAALEFAEEERHG
jgi:PAS domain S-box-containing protein